MNISLCYIRCGTESDEDQWEPDLVTDKFEVQLKKSSLIARLQELTARQISATLQKSI